MIRRKNRKLMALILSASILTTHIQIPISVSAEIVQQVQSKTFYVNDFVDESKKPGEVNGVIKLEDVSIANEMMKFNTNFNGTWDWDPNKHEFNFFTDSIEVIPAGALIDFDIIIPTDKAKFTGQIKFKGALKDSNWGWKDGSDGSFTSNQFEDLGNGFSKVTATATVSSELNGLKAIVVQIIGGGTDYTGDMYLDNVKVYAKASDNEVTPDVQPLKWDFADSTKGTNGWNFGGVWAHQGTPEISYDSNIGLGALKLGLDFTNDTQTSWSEVKLQNNLEAPVNINGYNVLTYDFIYNPNAMSMGGFKTKLYSESAIDSYTDIKLDSLEDVAGGLKKAKVKVKYTSVNKNINSLILAIIGANTDYKGDIYIDNIELSQEKVDNIYVNITENVTPQIAIDVNSLTLPDKPVKLVDEKITKEAASLYGYLKAVGETDKVVFGHQNDTHHKGGKYENPNNTNGMKSDTLDVTGTIAGMVGIDTLSFTGDELDGGVNAAVNVSKEAAQNGAVLTLSAHMPNFEIVKNKGLDAQGNYDYSGYTPGVTKGNIVQRIMPNGDLNGVFRGYLDLIAEYGLQLQDAGVPVLFRPFHENNGSWFWWGAAFCDKQAYKNLYAYTVEYLRDVKGVHNFLYVYSPNGPFEDKSDYLSRYPGDEFIDVIGFDMYHDNPTADDNWMSLLGDNIKLIDEIATEKGKLSALSEVGMRLGGSLNDGNNYYGIAQKGNTRKDWYNEVLDVVADTKVPYFMTWANFDDKNNFYVPYKMTETTGHEMINEFIDFYNDDRSIFAKETGDFLGLNVDANNVAQSYGYIINPISGTKVLEPTLISAIVKNLEGKVTFAIKDGEGKTIEVLNTEAKDGKYEANISSNLLEKIGEVIGTIELRVNDVTISSNNIIFNIKDKIKLPNLVDDFENYLGESALLQNEWSTNVGPGCALTPKLTTDTNNINSGKYGLEFNYKISTAKTSEGWAGMTIPKAVDWSGYDALQLWVKPDGKGQKLVIQITSNGEDFEVFLPEFTATTEPQLLTLKFEDFIGKNKGKFDPSNVTSIGIWCNTIVPKTKATVWEVDSKMYFDDIKAVNTKAVVEKNVVLDKTKLDIIVGDSTNIKATVTPETEQIVWTTSDEKVATVDDNGNIKAIGKGIAKITATIKNTNIYAICDINVSEKITVPVTPEDPTAPENTVKPGNNQQQESSKGNLPQTGGVNSVIVSSIGLILTMLGFGVIKKKEETINY